MEGRVSRCGVASWLSVLLAGGMTLSAQAEDGDWSVPGGHVWSVAESSGMPSTDQPSQAEDADASATSLASRASAGLGSEGVQADQFRKHAIWRVTLPAVAGASVCYDFDRASVVPDCQGQAWDLKVQSGRRVRIFTNSGANGPGRAGVYAPQVDTAHAMMQSWQTLVQWKSASQTPEGQMVPDHLFVQDRVRSAFSGNNRIQSAIFEHAPAGTRLPHDQRLYPSYRVFLVNSDVRHGSLLGSEQAPVYALQVIGYYGESGHDAGHVQLRWVDRRLPANLRQATIDSSRDWVYLDLATGQSSNVDDGNWHIAFKQYHVRLRGGDSARGRPGRVGGMIGMTSPRLYDASGRPRMQALMNARADDFLADLTASALDQAQGVWVLDRIESSLSPRLTVTPERNLDFGWYVEYPNAWQAEAAGLPSVHGLRKAMPGRGALVRSAEGNSHARFHLRSIDYQDPLDPASPQSWTFNFDVQPAAQD